jgi:hypothetical protein
MTAAPDIDGFWKWFADNHESILEIMAGRRDGKVTELLDRALESNHLNLTYEVTGGERGGELTFTPEGDPMVAAFIDQFLEKAPALDTWIIHGRIQRKPIDAAIAFVKAVHGIDLSDLHFKVRHLDEQYHLLFLSDALMNLEEDHRFEVAGTFLDHALGEARAMEYIGSVDFSEAKEGGIEMGLVINQITRETGGTGDIQAAS